MDFLEQGFANYKSFKILLKDNVFIDYFNTFLSLPIFSKKLFYRKDLQTFEVDPGPDEPGCYYVQEDVTSWVYAKRRKLFLKTDICNEYRLCKLIIEELNKHINNNQDEGCLEFEKELGSVLGMQRFKAFLHDSAGERVLIFWLATERYRRQTQQECRRFVLREIQEKFIEQGAWLELPLCLKSRFGIDLKDNEMEVMMPRDMNPDLLLASQQLAFNSLVDYWVLKFLAHREHVKMKIKKKWHKAVNIDVESLQLPVNGCNDKQTIFNVYEDIKERENQAIKSRTSSALTSSDLSEHRLGLASSQSTMGSEEFEERLNREVYEVMACGGLNYNSSQNSSHSFASDMIITIDKDDNDDYVDDDDDKHSDNLPSNRNSSQQVRLPPIERKVSVISENQTGSNADSNISRTTNKSSYSLLPTNTDHHMDVITNRIRDPTFSRTVALAQNIRGRSLLDIEPSSVFPETFIEQNKLEMLQGENNELDYFSAALASDQFAGHPFCDYIKTTNNDEAFANIRFWVAAQQFLSNLQQMNSLTRRRQAMALTHIYLFKDSPRKTTLTQEITSKLQHLLPKDLGFTILNAACMQCSKALHSIWKEFLKLDKDCFHSKVNTRFSSSLLSADSNEKRNKKRHDNFHNHHHYHRRQVKKKKKEIIPPKIIWNALQLAIAISVPRKAKPLLEGYDDVDEPDPVRDYQGSLQSRQLSVLNEQAVKALEEYRQHNPYHNKIAYYYCQQNLLLSTMTNKSYQNDNVDMITTEVQKNHYREAKPRLPKPRVFQEILHDPLHFDAFKKFLVKHDGECPLLFWQAVESMRTNTREAKQRQSRANGILRRFFGTSTNQGKDLACNADIVKELPLMNKVTPAMLVSAQTCVARSMEDRWFIPYLSTFPEDDDLPGITKLPQFRVTQGPGTEVGRGMKNKNRLLWKVFFRNVISFRRGIADHKTLKNFQNFLKNQHAINVKRSKEQGEEIPQRVLISSTLVYTDKLIHDLRFWSEVERYKDFADAVVLCAKLGNYTKDDELIVTKKAKAIVNCFIDSQIPPKIQINVSADTAESIFTLVKNDIIERGLFHDAAISVFAILLHYWKKFCYHRILPISNLPKCPTSAKSDRSNQIAIRKQAIRKNQMRRVSLQQDDEYSKIMFSLQYGLRVTIVPLEENTSSQNDKLPKMNPFKFGKVARTFNIN